MKNAASSNIVPYVLGEYKPAKLPDWTLREISELLRNAYDRQQGQRGTTEQVIINYPYRAPIILLGEGSPTCETAIKERAIKIIMSKRDSKPFAEGFFKLKCRRKILEKFGFLLLKTVLKTDENKLLDWYKIYYNRLIDIPDDRIRGGVAFTCVGLSLISRICKDMGISISLDAILNDTIFQLQSDIYEGQDPKSDAINTLELLDQLADIGILQSGIHYKHIKGTDELALCVHRVFQASKEHCQRTKTELQVQRDFSSQIKRMDCFVTDKKSVRLYDAADRTIDRPINCLILNLNKLKNAEIPTFSGINNEEKENTEETENVQGSLWYQ
jgi:hypothetical protein